MKTPDPHAAQHSLRQRAERRRLVSESLPPDAAPEVQRLVQELQVHQIELEMQNEELMLAQAEAEASRLQYVDLYDFAPVGYCTLSLAGTISQLNLRTGQLLGQARQQLRGRRLALFVVPAERDRFAEFMARLWARPGQRQSCELSMRRADETPFFAQLEGVAAPEGPDESLPPTGCRLVLLDVTARRRATDALSASEARLRATFEQARDGMVLLDGQQFVDLNTAALHLLGHPDKTRVLGCSLTEFWPEQQPNGRRTLDMLTQCLHTAEGQGWGRLEWLRHSPAGAEIWDELSFNPVQVNGRALLHMAWRDITARRVAEEELHYKNRLLRDILQNMPVLLTRIGSDGRYREHVGRALRRMGLADNELVGQLVTEVFPATTPHLERLRAGHGDNYQVSLLLRDGQQAAMQCFGFFDAERQEVVVFALDITDSERLKEEATRSQLRQQQELLSAILNTQEEERRRIAEALHNGVGQLLYGTRLHLDGLPPSEAVRASQDLLNEAIGATRTISFELTPSILEDFGLAVALQELVSRIPGSLAVDLSLRGLEQPLPPLLATAVYRIVQELLNNVMKHAQAREVFVQVAREEDQVHLSVEDDGVGFDTDGLASRAGIGLAGIRTRVGLLGGTFSSQSRPGRGTSFFLQVPVPAGG
ncbi:hypothetical protein A0257_13980 [Hymenobacter psoromatis]|nr:hypothetical protein A0257_13980 [Hymenobacter psoromatis]